MTAFVDCINKDLTIEQLILACLTKTAAGPGGEVAIRTMIVNACAEGAIDCTNNTVPLESLLKQTIGISSCGKPAIRLGIKPVDLAAAMGVTSYATLVAANAALAAGVIFFNIATGKLDITTA